MNLETARKDTSELINRVITLQSLIHAADVGQDELNGENLMQAITGLQTISQDLADIAERLRANLEASPIQMSQN